MDKRPLSPHLQIYHPALSMLMSIAHRASGMALYGGSALFALWLASIAMGEESYRLIDPVLTSLPGRILLFAFTWALCHHLLGGLRHLYWDTGRGFSPFAIEAMAWGTLLGGAAMNLALWLWTGAL